MDREMMKVFHYMRQVDQDFKHIVSQAESHISQVEKVSVVPLYIDINILELLDVCATLGQKVLHDRRSSSQLFQRFVYLVLTATKTLPENTALSQIHVILRVTNVPRLTGYTLSDQTLMCQSLAVQGTSVMRGKITEISSPMKYTQVACYFCPVAGCEGSYGFKYVRIHIPGAAEQTTVGKIFTCTVCGAILREEKSYRRVSDKLILHLNIMNLSKDTSNIAGIGSECDVAQELDPGFVRQRMRIVCRDDQALHSYSIGETVTVTGRLVYDNLIPKHPQVYLEANTVVQHQVEEQANSTKEVDLSRLPEPIQQLYKDRRDSMWSFAQAMAYLVGECISPAGTFVKLKLSLLLSLLSPSCNGLNVLCVGQETLIIRRLLAYFSELLPNCVTHSDHSSLIADMRDDRQTTAQYFISGGSCLNAHHSVCVVPDINALTKQENIHLERALEYGKVLQSVPRCSDYISIDVQCKIWACADSRTNSKAKTGSSLGVPISANKLPVNPCYNQLFDLVLLTDDLSSDYLEEISYHSLLQALCYNNPNRENTRENLDSVLNEEATSGYIERICHSQLKQFIEVARSLTVTFPEDVKSYLARFYLASRQVRSEIGNAIPTSSLKTMLSLAEAHARLSLRSVVTQEDALSAILLYEECMTSQTHHSVLNVTHEPHWDPSTVQYYLTQQNDEGMETLKTLVDNFCKTHCSSSIEE